MENKFKRNCPVCSKEILYTNIKNRNKAEKKQKKCKACVNLKYKEINRHKMEAKYLKFDDDRNQIIIDIFNIHGSNWIIFRKHVTNIFEQFIKETKVLKLSRKCPECSKEIIYNCEYSVVAANRKNTLCFSCCRKGERNPFFGKKHSQECIEKRTKFLETSEPWKAYVAYKHTDEYRQYVKDNFSGENSSRFGKGSLKDIWIKKYGVEEAEIRHKSWTDKMSIAFSGDKNPMYGKPSPVGSGNGWSGWYCGWYFRSLRELSYMITEIENKGLSWENGELKKYKISYVDWDGKRRNYFPDFVVDGKYMVECKPKSLHTSESVICKQAAAIEFCKKIGLEYILTEPEILSNEEIKNLHDSGKIKFLKRYEDKFLKLHKE